MKKKKETPATNYATMHYDYQAWMRAASSGSSVYWVGILNITNKEKFGKKYKKKLTFLTKTIQWVVSNRDNLFEDNNSRHLFIYYIFMANIKFEVLYRGIEIWGGETWLKQEFSEEEEEFFDKNIKSIIKDKFIMESLQNNSKEWKAIQTLWVLDFQKNSGINYKDVTWTQIYDFLQKNMEVIITI